MQHVMRMRPIILTYVTYRSLQYFSTLSQKRHDFRKKKVIEHKMCVMIQRDININVHSSSCQILIKLEFFAQIFEKSSNISFHENPISGGRVVPCRQTDRRTDG